MPAPAADSLPGAINRAVARPPLAKFRMLAAVAVGAGAFNAVNSGAVAWVKFHGHAMVPAWGAGGVVVNAVPSSIIPALLMVSLGTHAARRRLRRFYTSLPPLPGNFIRRLPAGLIARAALLACCAAFVVVTVTVLGVTLAGLDVVTFSELMVSQLVQAFVMGAVLGPIIVVRAFCESPPR